MPQHDTVTLLSDARRAASTIQGFIAGHSWEDYQGDDLLRSAVERQFTILGEALSQLSQRDKQVAAALPDLPRVVAFRNVLVHGYAVINDDIVWEIATSRLEPLITSISARLSEVSE